MDEEENGDGRGWPGSQRRRKNHIEEKCEKRTYSRKLDDERADQSPKMRIEMTKKNSCRNTV